MSRLVYVLLSAVAVVVPTGVEAARQHGDSQVVRSARVAVGRVDGTVRDGSGAPLWGATVSALGPTLAFAVTDRNGRFELDGLPPGPYVVRAHHASFSVSLRQIVEVVPAGRVRHSFVLHRVVGDASTTTPEILAAGAVAPGTLAPQDQDEEGIDRVDPSTVPHDHSDSAWRLRHVKRSVLKDAEVSVATADGLRGPDDMPSESGRAVASPARLTAAFYDDLALSGQFNLLTTSMFGSPADLFSVNRLPHGIAYVTLGAPAGQNGDWAVQAAMTNGDVASWVLAGSYQEPTRSGHALDLALSYSVQRYEGGTRSAVGAVRADRTVGSIHLYDRWQPSSVVALHYGGRYAWHNYLDRSGLFSPSLGVTVSPTARLRVHVGAQQRMLAPGAEEFLPPQDAGLWLPPERTFAPLDTRSALRVERSRQLEVAVEREFARAFVVSVRRFYEDNDDQLVTLFGVRPDPGTRTDIGHYFVASAGSVESEGWGVTLRRALGGRVRGSVDYSVTRARWGRSPDEAIVRRWAPSAIRPERESFQDVTAVLETEMPETGTRVFVVYRINTAYTKSSATEPLPGFDARFDVQIRQSLPFLPFGQNWEMLVAVRNLFREPGDTRFAYDELLVARPPKRIVGGLIVRF